MMHVDIRSMAVGVWAALRLFCACVRSIGSRERHVLVPSFVFSLSWLTLRKLQAKIADAVAVFLLCMVFSADAFAALSGRSLTATCPESGFSSPT